MNNNNEKKDKDRMGGAMFSLQNCTLQSEDRGNGESYWVSFEEKSFSKGHEFKAYSGKMNGIGPKSGDRCVVKVFRHCKGTRNMCTCEVKKSQKAKELARAFNHKLQDKSVRIKITTVYWALMDEVSKIKLLFFSGERKLSTKEAVLFEDDVRENEEKPNKPHKLVQYMDASGAKKRCIAKDLEAFAHFTYHYTNGQLVVCGFEGVHDDEGFFLKTPTIHSKTKEYGGNDKGDSGMREVFSHHVCNDMCKDMMKPLSLDECAADSASVSLGECCTAENPACYEPEMDVSEKRSAVDPIPSSSVVRPDYSWQGSKVSQESSIGNRRPSLVRGQSALSQATESMSGYVEPSAPALEDCDESIFQPPPYSVRYVANWLLTEQSRNSFIAPVFEFPPLGVEQGPNLMMPVREEGQQQQRVVTQMSVDSQPLSPGGYTCKLQPFRFNSAHDMQGNIAEADAENGDDVDSISCLSMTGCVDDCDGSERAASVRCDKKQVRFTVANDSGASTIAPSVATNNSTTTGTTRSESTMEMSTTDGGYSSRVSSQPRSILRQQSAPVPLGTYPPFVQTSHLTHLPATGLAHAILERQMSDPAPAENPPSYQDSQMATAYWIIRKSYESQHELEQQQKVEGTGSGQPVVSRSQISGSGQYVPFMSFPVNVNSVNNNYSNNSNNNNNNSHSRNNNNYY